MVRIKLTILRIVANSLGVPIQVHQSFFTKGKSLKRSSS